MKISDLKIYHLPFTIDLMNILLATYNYYPHFWGGSEVYVHGLAKFLRQSGCTVTVIAGTTAEHVAENPVIFEDPYLSVCCYEYEGITVLGCMNKGLNTTAIYRRYNPDWANSWSKLIKVYFSGKTAPEVLHLHAYTSLVNASLTEAVRRVFPAIKTMFSYHIPENCIKGTLYYFNKEHCTVRQNPEICTACSLHNRLNISPNLAKLLAGALPNLPFPDATPTLLRTKQLAGLVIHGFGHFIAGFDRLHVFSNQIQTVLQRFGVKDKQLTMIRHGIDDRYLVQETALPGREPVTTFLYFGRFKKVKGVHTALKAWLSLPESPERQLWLIGGAADHVEPEITALLEQATRRSDIQILGMLNLEEIRKRLHRAHCVLVPSEWVEIGPLVLHEALACGANVITTDIGGCAELAAYYGEACQTFHAGEVSELVNKITGFRFFPARHEVMGEAAHCEKILREYYSLTEAVLEKPALN